MKLDSFQEKKIAAELAKDSKTDILEFMRDLDIHIDIHYQKRSLDQNALMWSLYDIEAYVQNGGQEGHSDQMVTRKELYLTDLELYGEREKVLTKRKNFSFFYNDYKIESIFVDDQQMSPGELFDKVKDFDKRILITYIKGTSKLTTKEMSLWIDRIFNRLAYNGVPLECSGDLKDKWFKQQIHNNENKIILYDEIMTQAEYKTLHPLCEASGEYIGDGTGELSHIQGFGMGGKRKDEPRLNYTSNWLHLKTEIHRDLWHGKGVKEFLKVYPHLAYKVRTALNRNYETIEEKKEISNGKT